MSSELEYVARSFNVLHLVLTFSLHAEKKWGNRRKMFWFLLDILSVEYVSLCWRRVMCQLWQLSSRDIIVFYSALGLTNSSAICSGWADRDWNQANIEFWWIQLNLEWFGWINKFKLKWCEFRYKTDESNFTWWKWGF
jgi:hypothetical protein